MKASVGTSSCSKIQPCIFKLKLIPIASTGGWQTKTPPVCLDKGSKLIIDGKFFCSLLTLVLELTAQQHMTVARAALCCRHEQ